MTSPSPPVPANGNASEQTNKMFFFFVSGLAFFTGFSSGEGVSAFTVFSAAFAVSAFTGFYSSSFKVFFYFLVFSPFVPGFFLCFLDA